MFFFFLVGVGGDTNKGSSRFELDPPKTLRFDGFLLVVMIEEGLLVGGMLIQGMSLYN